MNGSLLTLLLAAVLAWQTDAPPEAANDEAIARAVQRLGDAEFAARRAASQFLWQQGRRAEEALRQAAQSSDVEMRLRAREILRDFEYGILPGVPREVVEQITEFRSGDLDARQRAVQSLVEGGHLDTAVHLIGLDRGTVSRRRLLTVLMRNRAAVEQYATLEKIESLVDHVAPDQDEAWRRVTVGELLFSPTMIERLADADQLKKLTAFLEREKDPRARAQILAAVFSNSTTVAAVIRHADLSLLFALADAAPNDAQRTQLLTQLLTDEQVIAQVLEQGRLDDLLDRMEKSLDANSRAALINQLLRSPALSQLFERRSIDELIEWLRQEKSPQLRGQLLAALMSSPAVQKKLREEGRLELIVDVMADEPEPASRRIYLEAVVGTPWGILQEETVRNGLWQLIKADKDIPWRAGVAEGLLRSGVLMTSFTDEEEVDWLLETIRDGGTSGKALAGALFTQHRTLATLLDNGHFDTLWELARESADAQRGHQLAQLVRHPSAAEVFSDAARVDELLTQAREEAVPAARQDYLRGLVASRAAVMAVLREGQYDAISEIVLATEDAIQRAELFGLLAQNSAASEHLRKQGQLNILLDFADAQPTPAARSAFLRPLFNSGALTLLLRAGHYDRLLAYVEGQPAGDHTLSVNFYANLEVVEQLVAKDQVAELVARAEAIGEAERSHFLQRLVHNRQLVQVLVDAGHIETLLALVDIEPQPARRGANLGSLLGSAEVARALVAQEKLPLVWKRIESEKETEVRYAMLRPVLANRATLTVWIDAGMLDPLVAVVKSEEDPRRKAELLGAIMFNDAALSRWKQEKQLASVLEMVDSFGRNDAARNARWNLVSRLFSNSAFVQKLIDEGVFDQLLRIATREPEVRYRARVLQSLVQHRATGAYLAAQNRLPELLEIAQDEPDGQVRQAYLSGLVTNAAAIDLLVDAGLYEEIAELVLDSRDAEQRASLYGRLVQQPRVTEHLKNNDQIELLLKFAEEQATPEIRNAFLQPIFSSPLLTLLIDRGHFDRLRSYLDDDVPSRDGLVASFYANSAVVDRLIEERQVDVLLARAQSIDADARYEFLRRLAYNQKVLSELVRSGHYDAWVALVRALPDASQRSSLLGTMWRSPQLAQQLAAQDKLGSVLEMLRGEQDVEARLRMLQQIVDNSSTIAVWSHADLIDPLIELIQEHRDPGRKRDLLVRLATNDALLQQWMAKGELSRVLGWDDVFGAPAPAMATARRQYLMRVFGDHNASNRLIRGGLYDQMLKLAMSEPTEELRFALLRSLAANFATAEYLASRKRLPELLEIAGSATTDAARRNYLNGLVSNFPAVTALVDSGHYDALADWVLTTEDAVGRAGLFGNLVRHGRVMRHLDEQKQLDSLWQFAEQQESPEARDAFLQPLFRGGSLRLLIERGHYDRLRRFLDEPTPAREALIANFYANSAVLDRMVAEKQIEPVLDRVQELDANGRYELLQRLSYQNAFLGEVVQAGHFDSLIALVRNQSDGNRRGMLLGAIVRTPQVAEQLAARDELADLLEISRAERDPKAQQMIVSQLLSDSRGMQYWTEAGLLDPLIELIQTHAESGQQAGLLARIVVQPAVLEQWAGEQTEKVLALGNSIGEKHGDGARADYLRHVFDNLQALRTLVEGGALERLLEIAQEPSDPTERAGVLQTLLRSPATADWLAKQQRAGRLVEIVRDEPDDAVRSTCLAGIVQNSSAIEALADAGQLEALVSLCRQISDDRQQRKLKAQLLLSPRVVEYLADQELLVDHLQAMLSDPDASERHRAFQQLVTQPEALRAIDRAGMFGRLIESLEAEVATPRFDGSSANASVSGELLALLVEHDRVPLVLALLEHSPHPAARRGNLAAVFAQPKVLRAVLEHESLDRLLENAAGSPVPFGPYGGGSLWFHTARSPEVVRIFVEHDQIGWLLEEAEQDPQSRYQLVTTLLRPELRDVLDRPAVADRLLALARLSHIQPNGPSEVDRLLSHTGLRQTLIARGDVDKLLELLPLARDRDRLRDAILFSPTGLVVHHIARGEIAAAEQVIETHATAGDEGRLLLATLPASSGHLQRRIDQLQQRIDEAAEPDPDDVRTLIYLHRAAGDLESAAAAAEQTGDADLVHAIAHERRDWAAAARQLDGATEGFALPVPLRRSPPTPAQRRIERLGRLAAYWRLAGDTDRANATLDQIEKFAARGGPGIQWDCAEALLLNDRIEPAMTLLEQHAPRRAFDLYSARLDYPAALRLVGVDDGTTFDAEWYASLPPRGANGEDAAQREQRLKLAVRIARLLRLWGRDEPAEHIIDFLKTHAQQQPEMDEGQETRRQHWEWLASELYKSEMYAHAWQAAEQATKPGQENRLVNEFFSTGGSEAMAWWDYFRRMHGDEPAHETLRRIHYLLHPAQSDAANVLEGMGDFVEMVEAASDISAMPPYQVSSFLAGLANTCIERGQSDLALRLLERVPEPHVFAIRTLALELGRRGRHREAAEQWMKLWQMHYEQPQHLYLSGHALVQAGEVEEGEKRKSQASMAALRSDVRHRMAIALHREGLATDAAEQWKLVTRTAPMDHWQWNDAVRLLGDYAFHENDHASAADRWEQYMLTNLRSNSSFNETVFYLRLPALIRTHRAAAAAAAGDCESAVAQAHLGLNAMPGQTDVIDDLVPRLQQQGCGTAADALFARMHAYYHRRLAEFPDSGQLHNNLAWLEARCHRRLDEALTHARRAVERSPDNAGYVDTLAEVHFHLGDRDEAVRWSERSVALAPQNDTFQKHLERFRSEPLPE